jgi:hypothetical protein
MNMLGSGGIYFSRTLVPFHRLHSLFLFCFACFFCSDLVLLQDKKFLSWVKVYSQDAKKFDSDFTAAFQKLEELGTSGLTPTEWA